MNDDARQCRGKYLLFLNNDTQVIAPDWMDELVACFERPEVAVAGAKLLFADRLVQHAGMIANPNGDNAHFNQNLYRDDLGYDCSAALPSVMNMVTGACQLVRHEVFDQLGGYDENLAVGFNDSEFSFACVKRGMP